MYLSRVWIVSSLVTAVACVPHDPSPAFPPPLWENGAEELSPAFARIESELKKVAAQDKYSASSFSIELTSNTQTLWSHHHTAREFNETRPGTRHVDGDSVYRIASNSKVFTTLGLLYLHEAGNLSLDDPVSKYLPGLSGELPWDDITLRIMASQLSGIPSNFALGDLLNVLPDPTKIGLPPASRDRLPTCSEFGVVAKPCTGEDLIHGMKTLKPIFAPNQKSTYSNLNFEILGIVLEKVTGLSYEEYMHQAIFEPLNMTSTTLQTPSDKHAVLPKGDNWWEVNQGVMNPTGGIYSTPTDMSKFARYILTHYNTIATGVNWILPASWAESIYSFYGMPFEIFRTDKILKHSKRPVTFVTKAGGMPGYYSRFNLMPEYGLGLTILVGGEIKLLHDIQEIVTVGLTNEAEDITWNSLSKSHGGSYTAIDPSLNSSFTLTTSSKHGLTISSFISNSTDVLHRVIPAQWADNSRSWRAQLVPTLLYKNESTQQGEIWRLDISYDRLDTVWDDFAMTNIDASTYAGLPINEVVFWHEEGVVELPAWKLKLKRREDEEGDGMDGLVVQSGQ